MTIFTFALVFLHGVAAGLLCGLLIMDRAFNQLTKGYD
jgi:hypothetical protein